MPLLHHLGQVIGHQLESLHPEREKSGHFRVHDHHLHYSFHYSQISSLLRG